MNNEPELEDKSVIERIDKREMKQLNDPNCQHLYQEDPTDDSIPGYKAMRCIYCPVGIMVKKEV